MPAGPAAPRGRTRPHPAPEPVALGRRLRRDVTFAVGAAPSRRAVPRLPAQQPAAGQPCPAAAGEEA